MTVKKFIALTAAAVAVSVTAQAQVAVDVVSAYVFRGGTINDEVNVQPGFDTTAFGGAVSVGTWANFNTDTSEFDEIDYFFGIPLTGEDSEVSVVIGYTEYVYNVGGEADREPYLSLGFGPASLGFYYGVGGAIEDSLYVELSAGHTLEVAKTLSLDLGAALGYLDPDEGESGFSHLTLTASTTISDPEETYSVAVGVAYVVETDEDVQMIDEDFYFTIGTSL